MNSGGGTRQKSVQEMSAIERLIEVQKHFKTLWKGIKPEFTGRPGTSLLCNNKRVFEEPKQAIDVEA